MAFKRILVVSDNESILSEFIKIIQSDDSLSAGRIFDFACHPNNKLLTQKEILGYTIQPLNLKDSLEAVVERYDLIISAHCKQLFPKQLVESRRCINIHPGYNPYNRGWYPQVFSIINGLPLGATIHEIDAELDHGAIIDQEQLELHAWDTSLTAYNRVQQLEILLLKKSLPHILNDTYETREPTEEGNLNLKKDFEDLLEIKPEELVTFQQAIDTMRALSHPPFKNAYFYDSKTGTKVWLNLSLKKDENNDDKLKV